MHGQRTLKVETFLHFDFWDKKGERFVRAYQQVVSSVEHVISSLAHFNIFYSHVLMKFNSCFNFKLSKCIGVFGYNIRGVIDCNEWKREIRHECTNMGKVKRLEL